MAVSASFWLILGTFGLALQNVGLMLGCGYLWVSSWCFDGVSIMSWHCVCSVSPVLRCCRLWVLSWFGGLYWWYVSHDLVASWRSVGDVLVALGRLCMCVMLCLRVILLMLRWHLSRTFGGVCAVSCILLLVGVLLVLAWRFLVVSRRHVSAHILSYGWILDISMVSCICAHGHATQHQTILHACGP